MNTEAATRTEAMPHTEELSASGEVIVMIVSEAEPGRPESPDAERAEASETGPLIIAAAETVPAPDLIAYLDHQAAEEAAATLAALGAVTIIARPAKTEPAPEPAAGLEAGTGAARLELEIQKL